MDGMPMDCGAFAAAWAGGDHAAVVHTITRSGPPLQAALLAVGVHGALPARERKAFAAAICAPSPPDEAG